MNVNSISFTSDNRTNNNYSALYSPKNYLQMGAISDMMFGTAAAFGVLECRDKLKTLKSFKNEANFLDFSNIYKNAKKQSKLNFLVALALAGAYTAADTFLTKKFLPQFEKTYDKLEEMKKAKNN